MGMRQRIEPTDDWQQLQLLAPFPEQRGYELLRPVVLFGQSPTERARQTGTAERTLYRPVARFEREGMASLFPPAKVEKHRTLPPRIRQAILPRLGASFRFVNVIVVVGGGLLLVLARWH